MTRNALIFAACLGMKDSPRLDLCCCRRSVDCSSILRHTASDPSWPHLHQSSASMRLFVFAVILLPLLSSPVHPPGHSQSAACIPPLPNGYELGWVPSILRPFNVCSHRKCITTTSQAPSRAAARWLKQARPRWQLIGIHVVHSSRHPDGCTMTTDKGPTWISDTRLAPSLLTLRGASTGSQGSNKDAFRSTMPLDDGRWVNSGFSQGNLSAWCMSVCVRVCVCVSVSVGLPM